MNDEIFVKGIKFWRGVPYSWKRDLEGIDGGASRVLSYIHFVDFCQNPFT